MKKRFSSIVIVLGLWGCSLPDAIWIQPNPYAPGDDTERIGTDTDTSLCLPCDTDCSCDTHCPFCPCAGTDSAHTSTDSGPPAQEGPRNLILFIGDGMGYAHVEAAGCRAHGESGGLAFEQFSSHASMMTQSSNNPVTDSAAGGTAIATGRKVNNGVIAMAIPGSGNELPTIADYYRSIGRSIGIVSTAHMTSATPAAFVGHAPLRTEFTTIARSCFETGLPDILMGGGGRGIIIEDAQAAGYRVVTGRDELASVNTAGAARWLGHFGEDNMPYELDGIGDLPHLYEMTAQSIAFLSSDPDGFFLMVEGGRIDHASHLNDTARMIEEMLAFELAVETATNASLDPDETLILVTADHECGGLQVIKCNDAGLLPDVQWTTSVHTGVPVPVYAQGPFADRFSGTIDNTRIYQILTGG